MKATKTNLLGMLIGFALAACQLVQGAEATQKLSAPVSHGVLASEIKVCPDGHTTLKDVPIRYGLGWGTTPPAADEFEYWLAGCMMPSSNPPTNRVTCTTCRLGLTGAAGYWSARAESPAAFSRPFSVLLTSFPVSTTNQLERPPSFSQTIKAGQIVIENLYYSTRSPAAAVAQQIDEWMRLNKPKASRTDSTTGTPETRSTAWKDGEFAVYLHRYAGGKTCGVTAMISRLNPKSHDSRK